jgi:hypothetical protein
MMMRVNELKPINRAGMNDNIVNIMKVRNAGDKSCLAACESASMAGLAFAMAVMTSPRKPTAKARQHFLLGLRMARFLDGIWAGCQCCEADIGIGFDKQIASPTLCDRVHHRLTADASRLKHARP